MPCHHRALAAVLIPALSGYGWLMQYTSSINEGHADLLSTPSAELNPVYTHAEQQKPSRLYSMYPAATRIPMIQTIQPGCQ